MGIKGLEFKEGNEGSIMSAGAGENWDEVMLHLLSEVIAE